MSNFALDNLVGKLLEDGYEFDMIMKACEESKDDQEVINKLKAQTKETNLNSHSSSNGPQNVEESKGFISSVNEPIIEESKSQVVPFNQGNQESKIGYQLKSIKSKVVFCSGKSELKMYNFQKVLQSNIKYAKLKVPSFASFNKKPLKVPKFYEFSELYKTSKRFKTFLEKSPSENIVNSPSSQPPNPSVSEKSESIFKFLISNGIEVSIAKTLSENCQTQEEAILNYNFMYPLIKLPGPAKPPIMPKSITPSFPIFTPKNVKKVLNQPEKDDPVAPDPSGLYFESLSKLRVFSSSDSDAFNNFSFKEDFELSPNALKRLNAEFVALRKNLPCDFSASVFLMYDSQDISKIRVLVSGPVDTVYAHGLYLFDVRIPANYPSEPPMVAIWTTGNGSFRFNPNLYSNGKVCLSLINTWEGLPEEKWSPVNSNLFQVLISIQSLVMTNKIIQNEPGYGKLAENSHENTLYKFEVLYGNIRFAIIDTIKNPPKGFEEVVEKHFSLKCKQISEMTNFYIKAAREYKPLKNLKSQNPGVQAILEIDAGKTFQKLYFRLAETLDSKFGGGK